MLTEFDQNTIANMTAALDYVCKKIPAGKDNNELRKRIADELIRCARTAKTLADQSPGLRARGREEDETGEVQLVRVETLEFATPQSLTKHCRDLSRLVLSHRAARTGGPRYGLDAGSRSFDCGSFGVCERGQRPASRDTSTGTERADRKNQTNRAAGSHEL
jgi:hypothetical protein